MRIPGVRTLKNIFSTNPVPGGQQTQAAIPFSVTPPRRHPDTAPPTQSIGPAPRQPLPTPGTTVRDFGGGRSEVSDDFIRDRLKALDQDAVARLLAGGANPTRIADAAYAVQLDLIGSGSVAAFYAKGGSPAETSPEYRLAATALTESLNHPDFDVSSVQHKDLRDLLAHPVPRQAVLPVYLSRRKLVADRKTFENLPKAFPDFGQTQLGKVAYRRRIGTIPEAQGDESRAPDRHQLEALARAQMPALATLTPAQLEAMDDDYLRSLLPTHGDNG